jgi:hypothetical protein
MSPLGTSIILVLFRDDVIKKGSVVAVVVTFLFLSFLGTLFRFRLFEV